MEETGLSWTGRARVPVARRIFFHDRSKALITIVGISFSVVLVCVQVGLFQGLLSNASLMIDRSRADLWITSMRTPNLDFPQYFSSKTVDRVRSVPGVLRADNLILSYLNITLPSGASEGLEVYAMRDFEPWGIPWNLARKKSFLDLRREKGFILDNSASRRFGPFRAGEYRNILQTRMRILDRSRGAISFTTTPLAFMDIRRVRKIQSQLLSGKTGYIIVRAAPGTDIRRLKKALATRLPFNDVYTSAEWARKSQQYWIESTGLGLNNFVTVFLGVLVGMVVVAQTLYSSTTDHLAEYGTIKAIGGSSTDIYRIVSAQAALAALLGFPPGLLVSLLLRSPLAHGGLKMLLPPSFVLTVFFSTVILCQAAGAISYRRISRIDPEMVFRQ